MKFSIVGGGRWGTAIGAHLARKGNEVTIYDINSEAVNRINEGFHPYVEGVQIPPNMVATSGLEDVLRSDVVVCALPVQKVRSVFSRVDFDTEMIISVSKGIEIGTFKRVTEIITELQRCSCVFALSGPSFAEEVSKGLPTAVVLAGSEDKMESLEKAREAFNDMYFRVYLNHDLVGVELGGALKNIIAIACGISDGLGFGYNARAALITRGILEMARVGEALGASRSTFFGLSGAGDLILTATSDLSRNRTFGVLLGKGYSCKDALESIGQVVEGAETIKAVYPVIAENGINAPIMEAVYRVIVKNIPVNQVVKDLLLRIPGTELVL